MKEKNDFQKCAYNEKKTESQTNQETGKNHRIPLFFSNAGCYDVSLAI